MTHSNNNRSLFWYTALIFAVAIVMIILAFLSQNNLFKNQPVQTDPSVSASISEKAAQLSEDNRLLLEQNKTLTNENEKLKKQLEALKAEYEVSSTQNKNFETLIEAYRLLYNWENANARNLLKTINSEELNYSQKIFYSILLKKAK